MKQLKQIFKLFTALAFCFVMSGCATLLCPKKTLTINSYPEGAAVYGIRDQSEWEGQTDFLGTTPLNKKVSSTVGYLAFVKEGYETTIIRTDRKHNPVVWANIIWPLGFAFDIGKFYKFADTNYSASLVERLETADSPVQPINAMIANSLTEMPAPLSVLNEIQTFDKPTLMSQKEIIKKYDSAVFMVYTSNDEGSYQGSGFFVSSNGLAVSNYHNFQGTYRGSEIIKTLSGETYKVKEIVAKSEKYDYIIFRVDGSGFNCIPVTRQGYEKGDEVYAIGSPRELENTFSKGMISAVRSENQYPIQINAPIDHGSSGGVLLNAFGQAIGITSAGREDSGANLNFAQDIRVLFPKNKDSNDK